MASQNQSINFSVAFAVSLVTMVRSHDGGDVEEGLDRYHRLTLKGLIALLSTITRAAFMVPVASVTSQRVWIWLSKAGKRLICHDQLQDLEIIDKASRGAWGSIFFLFKAGIGYSITFSQALEGVGGYVHCLSHRLVGYSFQGYCQANEYPAHQTMG